MNVVGQRVILEQALPGEPVGDWFVASTGMTPRAKGLALIGIAVLAVATARRSNGWRVGPR